MNKTNTYVLEKERTDKVRDDVAVGKLAVGVVTGFAVRPHGLGRILVYAEKHFVSGVVVRVSESEQRYLRNTLAGVDNDWITEDG